MSNENTTCRCCGKEFETEKQLHGHLRAHSLRMVGYYQKFYPRYDLYDGKIIKFKNKKQYFDSDFNSRRNLGLWLKSRDEKEAQEYCSLEKVARQMKKPNSHKNIRFSLKRII